MKKQLIVALGIMALFATNAYGGTWKTGEGQNAGRWWYDYQDGTYAKAGWYWLDGNGDGVEECYYFDSEGWLLTNAVTPDGYTVYGDGAWVMNQEVQTRSAASAMSGDMDMASVERSGRYVIYATSFRGGELSDYDSDTTRMKYYVEMQEDGRLKFITETWDKDFYVDEIEETTEMIFEKISDSHYLHITEYGTSYEIQFSADGTFMKRYSWTNPISGTVTTQEQYFKKALN